MVVAARRLARKRLFDVDEVMSGLDWSDGNLRLVNVQGDRVLGSEVAVRDRSVDIPVKQWLYVFNSLFTPNYHHI
ncbi:unnamed protein product [Gongylonema pulchrum]|uniref:SAM-dependent methyltransferase n=1 Tax=Gongylonema pulchrum TaxID=637853 RepID=A0A183EBL4_9BILA|nr:unnamed protein product [Gongylonema pulchrum]